MEGNEKLIAIEHIIYEFADRQFKANGVTPAEAAIVMEAISGRIQRQCIEAVIMGMVSSEEPEPEPENADRSDKTKETGKQANEDDKEKLAMLKEFEKSTNAQDEKAEETTEGGGDECRHTE